MENMIKAAPSDVNTLVNRKLQAIIIDDPCVDRDPAFCELKLPDIAAKSVYCKTLAIVQHCLETCGFCPACDGDPAWARKNHPEQKCAWVAENPRKRCKKKSKTGVKAKKVCLVACNKC